MLLDCDQLLIQGVAMPAMNNILSKWIPVSERSRALALVYSGMYMGSVTGLALSPILIQKFGWPSVFYSFGSLGSIWFVLWLKKVTYLNSLVQCNQWESSLDSIRCLSCRHIAHRILTQSWVHRRRSLSWEVAHRRNPSQSFLGSWFYQNHPFGHLLFLTSAIIGELLYFWRGCLLTTTRWLIQYGNLCLLI